MTTRRPVVFMLMVGPKFDLEWEFGKRLQGFSRFSSGYLITTSSTNVVVAIGDYVVHGINAGDTNTLWTRLTYIRRCAQILRAARAAGQPVDIILTYDALFTGVIGLVLSRLFGAILVCEVNGDYTSEANYWHIPAGAKRKIRMRLAIGLARLVLRRARGIKVLFDDQLAKLGVAASERQVIRRFTDFVDVSAFHNLGEQPVVLLVGFPFHVKGVDIAVIAFKKIAAEFPEWTLKIMGYYPDSRELEAVIGDCTRIAHQRPVRHRNMNEHIGRCGIFLLPSRTEAMGRVLIEAMAAAKPRVASRVGGIPTVIDDGVDGILVESEDVNGFALALARLMKSRELRQRLGNAGALRADREFKETEYFDHVEEFLGAAIASK